MSVARNHNRIEPFHSQRWARSNGAYFSETTPKMASSKARNDGKKDREARKEIMMQYFALGAVFIVNLLLGAFVFLLFHL